VLVPKIWSWKVRLFHRALHPCLHHRPRLLAWQCLSLPTSSPCRRLDEQSSYESWRVFRGHHLYFYASCTQPVAYTSRYIIDNPYRTYLLGIVKASRTLNPMPLEGKCEPTSTISLPTSHKTRPENTDPDLGETKQYWKTPFSKRRTSRQYTKGPGIR
jgi:hypothetical protein